MEAMLGKNAEADPAIVDSLLSEEMRRFLQVNCVSAAPPEFFSAARERAV